MLRRALLAGLLAVGLPALLACNSGESIRIENKTERTVVVYEDGQPTELIASGGFHDFDTQQFRGTLKYEVRYFCDSSSCDQTLLATKTVTWDEIKATGGATIVVQ